MKKPIRIASVIILALFGAVSVFMTSSVLLDLFGIRDMEGNYVEFVVIANLIAGVAYLVAAFGMLKERQFSTRLLGFTTLLLIITLIGILFHIYSGKPHESKTITAMTSRILITAVFTGISFRTFNNPLNKTK